MSETSDDDEEGTRDNAFAQISRSESFFDESGDLHLIYTFRREDYLEDTLVEISAANQGILGTKVAPKKPSNSTFKCCGHCQNEEDLKGSLKSFPLKSPSSPRKSPDRILNGSLKSSPLKSPSSPWESPTKILKESFGYLNLSRNINREDVGPSASEASVFSNARSSSKNSKTVPDLEENFKTSWVSDQKDSAYLKKEPKTTSKKVPPKTLLKEPKSKKFRRIIIVSSSESDDSEDEGKKKPATRQPRKRAETVLKAENYFEEDVIEKVYRYEGVYWAYNKKEKDLFDCFECSKNKLTGNVIKHFMLCHSALIAE